jgi:flavin-binding protein dodecin
MLAGWTHLLRAHRNVAQAEVRRRMGHWSCLLLNTGEDPMADSVYRVTEVIGVSSESWEAAARAAVETAAKTVRDLRVAEVVRQDLTIQDGGVVNFRVRLGISFKYGTEE